VLVTKPPAMIKKKVTHAVNVANALSQRFVTASSLYLHPPAGGLLQQITFSLRQDPFLRT